MTEAARSDTGKSRSLWQIVHADEKGGVSIETVLILAAVALPILIFVIKFGWPKIKEFFLQGVQDLEEGANQGREGGGI